MSKSDSGLSRVEAAKAAQAGHDPSFPRPTGAENRSCPSAIEGPLPIELFEYDLPAERIADAPARPRDASRLMVMPRRAGAPAHRAFLDLPEFLRDGDLLVVNRTQVIPARLNLRKPTGGKVEILLSRPLQGGVRDATAWEALGRPGRALKPGVELTATNGTVITVTDRQGEVVRVRAESSLWDLMHAVGHVPLPPYIPRPNGPRQADRDDYQTVFASEPGAVAAPTAALHFTERVLTALDQRGVRRAELLLHVGPGTFLPIRAEHRADVRKHSMHAEWYDVPEATQRAVEATRAAGGRVVAVGTTSVRALETWKTSGEASGESRLFVVPGFDFQVVDAMLTNFHLPGSTLMMLVAAFAGRERILAAYKEAVAEGYRFFSYGDAMLLA